MCRARHALKLEVLLDRDGLALTRSTIHRIVLRYDRVRDQDRRSPATQRRPRRLEARPLAEATEWLENYRQFWQAS